MKVYLQISLICIGVGLLSHGYSSSPALRDAREFNFMCIKESPYGEIVGAALQDPVHLIWHGGKGHDHHKADENGECTVCGVSHEAEDANYVEGKFFLNVAKLKMLRMEANIRQSNWPSKRHSYVASYEKNKVKQLMLEAFEMDPTNYSNYNGADKYINKNDAQGVKEMVRLAEKVYQATNGRLWDPEDALTAASAAETVMIYRARANGINDKKALKADYDFFADKVQLFVESFERAESDRRIYYFSQEKVDEMLQRYKYFQYSLREYGKVLGNQYQDVILTTEESR